MKIKSGRKKAVLLSFMVEIFEFDFVSIFQNFNGISPVEKARI